MKKLLLSVGLVTLLNYSCKKETGAVKNAADLKKTAAEVQERPRCATEEVMASLSADMRNALARSAETNASQATELLLYLDFDGAIVRPGFPNPTGYTSTIVNGQRLCPASFLNPAQIATVIEMVEDDFSPFNIRVTTDLNLFNTYSPANNKQICIVTTLPQVIGMGNGVGGVSPFSGPGIRLPFNPCFVFANVYGAALDEIAMTISHEAGHSMGLAHQSLFGESCNYLTEYHPGFGTGPLSFSPIMGGGDKRVTNWFAQPCPLHLYGGTQNDFEELNSQVVLRADDFPNFPSGNTVNAGNITGILEQAGDVDFISINFKNPGAVTVSSENIDLKVSVYNNGGHLMGEYNDPEDTGVTIPGVNGKRYLKIEAASNENMSSQFMTGQYKITY